MAGEDLAESVKKLIADHITSVEQLEILMLLRTHPHREWTADDVSEEIRTSVRSAADRLADLRARSFLAARDEGGRSWYRYAPEDSRLRDAIEQLARAYSERRYTVIDLIFAKPIDRLRVYADAFRFRKDDSDG
jgi:hypothetical protein